MSPGKAGGHVLFSIFSPINRIEDHRARTGELCEEEDRGGCHLRAQGVQWA